MKQMSPPGHRRECPNARICDRCSAAAVNARVLDKIAILQTWERHTASGMTERPDGTEFEPMTKIEREQLTHLIELRDMIRKKLIEHGQIEA